MEEAPGLKGMKKRLKGDHKTAIKTRADEAADLFAQITELVSCSEEEAEADRQAALPRLQALFAAVRDFEYTFDLDKEADAVENAVKTVLKDGYRTIDIHSEGTQLVSCSEMGDLICERI